MLTKVLISSTFLLLLVCLSEALYIRIIASKLDRATTISAELESSLSLSQEQLEVKDLVTTKYLSSVSILDQTKSKLISRVKDVQIESDPDTNDVVYADSMWIAYCKAKGGGDCNTSK